MLAATDVQTHIIILLPQEIEELFFWGGGVARSRQGELKLEPTFVQIIKQPTKMSLIKENTSGLAVLETPVFNRVLNLKNIRQG